MRLKKNSKLIIIFSLMLVVFAVVTFYYFYSTANTDPDTITFEEQSKNEYSVCLKDNNYFDEKCLNSERNYVAEIIDYVDINFNYLVKYSKAVKNSYTYSVVANLIATSKDEESKILYNKEEILLPAKTYQSEAANIDMTQNVKIDYNKYNNIINSFRKDYVISLNSKLIVTFIIKYNVEISKTYSDKSLNRTIKVEIPLGEQTVSISNDNNYNNTEVLHKNIASNNQEKIILYSLIVIDGLIFFIIVGLFIKLLPTKNKYEIKINKILRQYDQAIVILSSIPDLENYNVMKIATFDELLDARENLGKPILFYQDEYKRVGYFILMNENEAYIYTIKENEC